ncbi:MAG: bifunctional precorrin-2 dehydrogenase/sirohydrochlorin ferrochelatase [Candidatus Omnitrophota bacterium]
MRYYPIMLNIKGKDCIVIGGGVVAERKVLSLLVAGGKITIISPNITKRLRQLLKQKKIIYKKRKFQEAFLHNASVVIAATANQKVNQEIYHFCQKKKILVNVVDNPKLSSFIVPAAVARGDLVIAVSTQGKIPMLAKKIKEQLEQIFSHKYVKITRELAQKRKDILNSDKNPKAKKKKIAQLIKLMP